jgi:hypothetical protein
MDFVEDEEEAKHFSRCYADWINDFYIARSFEFN